MQIAIFGAGSIGCYLGGRLAAAGASVVLIGRRHMAEAVAGGLLLSDYRGARIEARGVPFATGPEAAAEASLVLVCVKSADSARAGAALRSFLPPATQVISFQNGIGNAAVLARVLDRPVIPGMVGFNVRWLGGGQFHQGTQGQLHLRETPRLDEAVFARAGIPLSVHAEMGPVLWAKLMLNLNNAINALSGLPLREELADRDYRYCLARAQAEFLGLCALGGQPLARLTPLPPDWMPRLLRLPDPLFRLLAANMLAIDPMAHSSMADDLARGRPPELDAINGEVARLARRLGREAPVNDWLSWQVREAAQAPRRWSGAELRAGLPG